MPRINKKKKNRGGKTGEYRCASCADPIVPGDDYYEWSFRYGGTHRQHTKHGRPMPSQLTQSKMSGAYAAAESAEDEIQEWTAKITEGEIVNVDDLASILDAAAEEIGGVGDEYGESADAIEQTADGSPIAEECREKQEALDAVRDALESAASDIRSETEPEENEDAEDVTERLRERAAEALQELP